MFISFETNICKREAYKNDELDFEFSKKESEEGFIIKFHHIKTQKKQVSLSSFIK